MKPCDPAILNHMRALARNGSNPSQILRALIALLNPEDLNKITLIKYMREGFCLSLQQASPVAGWSPDHGGELDDQRLDDLIIPEIELHKMEWVQ